MSRLRLSEPGNSFVMSTLTEEGPTAVTTTSCATKTINFKDNVFEEHFIKNVGICFSSMDDLTEAINAYEKDSRLRTVIRKSSKISRLYKCGSHDGCSFSARFGQRYADNLITLKKHCIIHTGNEKAATAKGGRT